MSALRLAGFDPRFKLVAMLCISTLSLLVQQPLFLLGLLLFTLLLLLVGGEPLSGIVRQSRGGAGFCAFVLVIQCVFVRTGEPLLSIGSFALVYTSGLMLGVTLALRLLVIIISALILLTSDTRDYLCALVQMKLPYELAFMLMIGVHFFPVLRDEAQNTYYSVQLRGTEIKKAPLRKKAAAYMSICLPILAGALNRAKATSIAMEARCFRLYPRRTYARRITLKPKDVAGMALFIAATVALLILYL